MVGVAAKKPRHRCSEHKVNNPPLLPLIPQPPVIVLVVCGLCKSENAHTQWRSELLSLAWALSMVCRCRELAMHAARVWEIYHLGVVL